MKKLIILLLSVLLSHSVFAINNSCEEKLEEIQRLVGDSLDEVRDGSMSQAHRAISDIEDVIYQGNSRIEARQASNRGLIKLSHFFKGSQNCPGTSTRGPIIESGAIVDIIIDSPTFVDGYKKAIKVRVVSGIGSAPRRAVKGCVGWVLDSAVQEVD